MAKTGCEMTRQERRKWIVLAGLFLCLFLIIGPSVDSIGVYFTPLLHEFHRTRAQISLMFSIFAAALGVTTFFVGWMLDRIDARPLMIAGAGLVGITFITAAHSHSLSSLLASFLIMGIGAGASGMGPSAVVIANWFTERRALAMAVLVAGMSAGSVLVTPLAAKILTVAGWRTCFELIAIPIFVLAIPILAFVAGRPPHIAESKSPAGGINSLAGLELSAALHSDPFWKLVAVTFLTGIGLYGPFFHFIPFLITAGYTTANAAWVYSAKSLVSMVCGPAIGNLADRWGCRRVLTISNAVTGIGILVMLGATDRRAGISAASIIAFVLLFGSCGGTVVSLVPALTVETIGLRRFGTISGILLLTATVGQTLGPSLVGKLYDLSGSYALPFAAGFVLEIAAALVTWRIFPAPGSDQVPAAPSIKIAAEYPA
jgi:MFS family permease